MQDPQGANKAVSASGPFHCSDSAAQMPWTSLPAPDESLLLMWRRHKNSCHNRCSELKEELKTAECVCVFERNLRGGVNKESIVIRQGAFLPVYVGIRRPRHRRNAHHEASRMMEDEDKQYAFFQQPAVQDLISYTRLRRHPGRSHRRVVKICIPDSQDSVCESAACTYRLGISLRPGYLWRIREGWVYCEAGGYVLDPTHTTQYQSVQPLTSPQWRVGLHPEPSAAVAQRTPSCRAKGREVMVKA